MTALCHRGQIHQQPPWLLHSHIDQDLQMDVQERILPSMEDLFMLCLSKHQSEIKEKPSLQLWSVWISYTKAHFKIWVFAALPQKLHIREPDYQLQNSGCAFLRSPLRSASFNPRRWELCSPSLCGRCKCKGVEKIYIYKSLSFSLGGNEVLPLHMEGLFLLFVPVNLRAGVALFLHSGWSQSCGSIDCLLFATYLYPFLPDSSIILVKGSVKWEVNEPFFWITFATAFLQLDNEMLRYNWSKNVEKEMEK